ncbi:SCO2521 family protein [Nocardia sp. NPDC004068]|uniref:SCO2521 family protein n=1 Tax=Nocardia sp. NPDC004068 TaxID=3364303 RepID=UPI0036BC08BD
MDNDVRPTAGHPVDPPLVVLGHVGTSLLPSPNVLDIPATIELLSTIVRGSRVTSRERPVPLAISAPRVEGVDCVLPVSHGRSIRGIGTVLTRALVVGGRISQSSSLTTVIAAEGGTQRPWKHYLASAGTVEAMSGLGSEAGARLALGHVRKTTRDSLDLGAISGRMTMELRMDDRLAHAVPFRTAETQLRWAAEVVPDRTRAPVFAFTLESSAVRSVRLRVGETELPAVQRFCEDLAVHDWLLTTLTELLSAPGHHGHIEHHPETTLALVLEHIVPLWMPGAHTPPQLRSLWADVEQDPGFTLQWSARVNQLRDRMAAATLDLLRRSKAGTSEW